MTKAYNSYKSSEIDWIEQIPSHWSEKRIKYLFSEKPSTQNTDLNSGSISFGSVVYKDDNSIPESTKLSYQEVLVGEFLINPLNLNYDLKSLRTALSDKNVVVSQGYIVLRLEERDTDQSFFKHLLRVFDVEHMKSLGSGVRQTISFNHLGTEALPLPPIKEQKAIASFLDTTTSLIDSLIEKTQRKIELLREKRTSLINVVVTKGLNPNVEMKDSGVEWIGEVPSHYEIGKLKHLCNENQRSLSNSTDPNYELNYIEISDVNSEGVIENHTPYTFGESPSRCRRIVQKGDVIVSTVRTYLKSIGLIEDKVDDLICSTGFSVLTPLERINSKYLFYLLRTEWFISKVISKSEGVSYPSIQSEKLMNIDIVHCELLEQKQIVEYLDEQIHRIDKTVSNEEEKIKLLKEYRQSLISSVVTGKIKVTEDA